MGKTAEFKKELFITAVIWAFIVAGAGVFFCLKHLMEPKLQEEIVEAQTENEGEQEAEDKPTDDEKEERPTEETESESGTPAAEVTSALGPSPFAGMAQNANGTNTSTTYNAVGHVGADGVKYIYYKTMIWGAVTADFEDFRAKVAETLNDARGWTRAGLRFMEVTDGQDLNVVLSDKI